MKNQKGFTLIEITVVVSIIALLASVLLVALNSARKKARDARRMADMKQITTALDFYYDTNGSYPNVSGNAVNCDGWDTSGSPSDFLQALVTAKIISISPADPLNSGGCVSFKNPINFFAQKIIKTAWATAGGPPPTSKPSGSLYVYRYQNAGDYSCDVKRGNYYVLGVPKMESVPGVHPLSPGFSCNDPTAPWANFAWVTGKFEK
ncbi:MAG: type II secretion system protein [Candidatus Doudnabacteria bacterium]|jgi:prepilin-type N-terminal cleavage/methylation domain-containing protein